MPKLSTDWRYDNKAPFLDSGIGPGDFASRLPSRQKMQSWDPGVWGEQLNVELLGYGWDNYVDATGRAIYRVANTVGVMRPALAGVASFLEQAPKITGSVAFANTNGLVQGGIMSAVDLAVQAVSAIPVVGWVVQIGYVAGVAIAQAMRAYRANPEQARPAIEYSKAIDEDRCNDLLDVAQGNDWTRVFLPPAAGDFESVAIDYLETEKDGTRVVQTQPRQGFGAIPGVPAMMGAYQTMDWPPKAMTPAGKWEVSKTQILKKVGVNLPWGAGPRTTIGDWVPSARQLAFSMWGMVRKNSPQAFMVDHAKISAAWRDHFGELGNYIEWLHSKGGDQNFNTAAALTYETVLGAFRPKKRVETPILNIGGGQFADEPFFSAGNASAGCFLIPQKSYNLEGLTADYVCDYADPAMFVPSFHPLDGPRKNDFWVLYWPLVRYVIDDAIEATLRYCDTLTIAYVDESFPAIANNSKIRERWSTMRQELLRHPARHDVDLDMIPDSAYREAMYTAQRSAADAFAALPPQAQSTAPIQTQVPDLAPAPRLPSRPADGGLGRAVLGAGALGLLGYGAYRLLR